MVRVMVRVRVRVRVRVMVKVKVKVKVKVMNEGFFKQGEINKMGGKKPLPPILGFKQLPDKPKSKLVVESSSKVPQLILDIECYINYFLVKFKTVGEDYYFEYEQTSDIPLAISSIRGLLKKHEIITFNGINYDIPMLRLALDGATNRELKSASDDIVQHKMRPWNFEKKYNLSPLKFKHIDIMEIPKGFISLKIYGGRLHCHKMQDLPYPEDSVLTDSQMDDVLEYCGNDLQVTELVTNDLLPQIELRRAMSKQYKLDLLSKSDAQIAEAVIKEEYLKATGIELVKPEIESKQFYYVAPKYIDFNSKVLRDVLDIVETRPFRVNHAGDIFGPTEFENKYKIKIGKSAYTFGLGGLHSTEKRAFRVTDNDYTIRDWDVASYYPEIILKCKLFPRHMGKGFLDIYQKIVTERLAAKRKIKEAIDKIEKNKAITEADSKKIVINAGFGKFGSPYSILYSPELLVQVTITGQLSILMLIEMMEESGLSVVSGNTDGIVIKCPIGKEDLMYDLIAEWEDMTVFTMEESKYAGIFSRDVNNYIAIKENGEVKQRGIFKNADIEKNPDCDVCNDAMVAYLKYGTPFEVTIKNCFDIRKFVTIQNVTGGATKNGVYLGKAVRWYYAKGETGTINYITSGNTVASTAGAKPLMELPDKFPEDIDYDWYISNCYTLFGK